MSNEDFDDKSVPYRYVGVEMSVCPQCGRHMSNFSAKHFGVCNGCKDRNNKKKSDGF